MKVHHFNCGTMRLPNAPLVGHVLLVETDNGLVLVDTGYGLKDILEPAKRIGPARYFLRPSLEREEPAIRQMERLGLQPRDVRHIILTHFDSDHVGGLADFPHAEVNLTSAEAFGARHPQILLERQRYRPAPRDHNPRLVEHTPAEGEVWGGFTAAKELSHIAPGIVLIALPGHTRGHAAVAVDAGDHWILHTGDAFYHLGQVDQVHACLSACA